LRACARCPRASSARNGANEGILEAVKRGLERDPRALLRIDRPESAPNGAATVELLKVLLRMTSETHGVAAKVIATVDDLDRIAGDDQADVPALKGWRRELFGEKALALKHANWRWRSSETAWWRCNGIEPAAGQSFQPPPPNKPPKIPSGGARRMT
jgi:ribonuclease D